MRVNAVWLARWRLAFVALAAVDIVTLVALTLSRGATDGGWRELSPVWGGLAGSTPGLVGVAAVGLTMLAWFARRPGALWAGALGLATLAAVDQAYGFVHGTFGANFHHSGACLAGWLLGGAVARAGGLSPDGGPSHELAHDRWAGTGALAFFCATYVMAAWSKLAAEGLDWAAPEHLQLVILSTVSPDSGPIALALRDAVLASDILASSLAVYTLLAEALAPLALLGVWWRRGAMAAVAGFHLGVAVTMGFIFSQAMLLNLLFAVPGRDASGAHEAEPPTRATLWWLAGLALLAIVALWLLPIEPRALPVDSLRR